MGQMQRTPQLCMLLDSLEGIQAVVLPDGYFLRTSTDGDGAHWARIIRESFDNNGIDEIFFEQNMRNHEAYRPERIFFAVDSAGLPCATASAYRGPNFGPSTGYVHYVGVCPHHAGKRLGYTVTLAVPHQFKAEGLARAVLLTDDFRLPAIKTYLNLGFVPLIVHENQPARWDAVCRQLGLVVPPNYVMMKDVI